MDKKYITFKIIVVGQQGTGKTALLFNYIKGDFKADYNVTIGVEFCSKIVEVEDANLQLQIWDTAGQQAFKSVVKTFYKGSCAIIFTYAIDDQKSFHNMKGWVKQVQEFANEQSCYIIVGTKLDCSNKRKVDLKTVNNYASQINAMYWIETSAKTGENIQILFKQAASLMYTKYKNCQPFRQLVNPGGQQKSQTKRRTTSISLQRPVFNNKLNNNSKKCC